MNSICRAIVTKPRTLLRASVHSYSTKKATATATAAASTGSAYRTTKYPPAKKPSKPPNEPKAQRPSELVGSESKEWERPKEIPYQPKIVNWVTVIGYVHSPVLTYNMVCTDDGVHNFTAFTVLSHTKHPHSFRIPIVFEGDLAHIAACHLKENDCIYVGGHLTPLRAPFDVHQGEANFQVVVQDINFVEKPNKTKNVSATPEQQEAANCSEISKDEASSSWKDLMSKPKEWWDIRSKEGTPDGAAFEHKTNAEVLVIDDLTPKWIQQEVKSLTFDPKPLPASEKGTDFSACETKRTTSELTHWRELVDNPKQWRDFRSNKLSGLVKPKYPDFKHKDTGIALWLNNAPRWVLSKLEGLEFDIPIKISGQQKVNKGEESWKALVENPDKWWDNRLNKRNDKAPDFRHKDTGEALWLGSSPAWVQEKLPTLKAKQGADGQGGDQLSEAT